MLTYQNTIYTREQAINLAQSHQDADRFVQGTYWDYDISKGCSVGCMVKDVKNGYSWHEAAEHAFGIPRQLAYMQDCIFEGLPTSEAKLWTVRLFKAIPENADLSNVIPKLMLWLMTDPDGVRKYARPDGLKAIDMVADLYTKKLNGESIMDDQWRSARKLAAAAADAAAYAAAAAAYAAYAAAAAAYAAYAAAAAARESQWRCTADKLIEILEETKGE